MTVAANFATWTTGILYLYYVANSNTVLGTTDLATAVAGSILATYKGGTDLTSDEGRAFVSGDMLLAGTVGSNALVTNTAVITTAAQIGNIIESDGYSWTPGAYNGWRIDKSGYIQCTSMTIRKPNGDVMFSVGTGMEWQYMADALGTKPVDNANKTYIDSVGTVQGVSSGAGIPVSNAVITVNANLVRSIDTWVFDPGTIEQNVYAENKQVLVLPANVGVATSEYMVLIPSTDYTISFQAWATTAGGILHVDLFPDVLQEFLPVLTTTPTLYTYVFNSSNSAMTSCQLRFFLPTNTSRVGNVKVERSSTRTAWTPHILDQKWDNIFNRPTSLATLNATDGTTLSTAASNAAAANAEIAIIVDDDILDKSDKPKVRKEWDTIYEEYYVIAGQAQELGTDAGNYIFAISVLYNYLNGGGLVDMATYPVVPLYINNTNLTVNTNINGVTLKDLFVTYYAFRAILIKVITDKAATLALWSGVTGAGKADDNATIGASFVDTLSGNFTPDTVTFTKSTTMTTTNVNTFTKVSGSSTVWGDAQVYTNQSRTSACTVRFSAGTINQQIMGGLNSDPSTDGSYVSLDYAIYFVNDGSIAIYESNVAKGTYGTYTTDDVFEVTYSESTIYYLKNGVTFKTTTTTAGRTFYFDSALLGVGGVLKNVQFGVTNSVVVTAPTMLGKMTPDNVTTFIDNAAIGSAQIGSINLTGNYSFGQQQANNIIMDSNSIRVYDAGGVCRVRLGNLL